MTKSKSHFVKQICTLKNLDPEGDEAKELLNKPVVELLTIIKECKSEPEPEAEPESEPEAEPESESDSDDESFARRCGSRFR